MAAKQYPGEKATISYDMRRCIHAAACVKGNAQVFDANRKPWVEPDAAPPEELAAVVERCPSGALSIADGVGASLLQTPAENHVRIAPNGPLYFRGNVSVERMDGEPIHSDTRIALCRCGSSENKPFCDGSHWHINFKG